MQVLTVVSAEQLVSRLDGFCVGLPCNNCQLGIVVPWECLFFFDFMIFLFTLYKSYKEVSRGGIATLSDLVVLIVRDGQSISPLCPARYSSAGIRCCLFRVSCNPGSFLRSQTL